MEIFFYLPRVGIVQRTTWAAAYYLADKMVGWAIFFEADPEEVYENARSTKSS